MKKPLVIGIESTCDETGVAFVRGQELLADVTATSMDEYARYGGIIPEIASRAHLESFLPTLEMAAEKAGIKLKNVDAIACAAGPGLIGSLTVGISAAKALALALDKPLYGVNHVIGHLAVDQLIEGSFPDKFIGLIVSGGHSNLVYVEDIATKIEYLGGTLDDAAGEAFDKVGRLLNTPYPGGPHVDKLSQAGDPKAIRFPRGLAAGKDRERHRYDFSFSGLKTAVARYVQTAEATGKEINRENICAGFSESVNDSLTAKAIQAALDYGCQTIVVGGGFSANSRLRSLFIERAVQHDIKVRIPPLRFCTDNGAQIAALGVNLVQAGCIPSNLDFGPDSGMPLTQIYMPGQAGNNRFWDGIKNEGKEDSCDGSSFPDIALLEQLKKNLEKTIDMAHPYLDQALESTRPYAVQAGAKAREYSEQILKLAYEYSDQATRVAHKYSGQALEAARPYAEQAGELARIYAEHARKLALEYTEQAIRSAKPYAEQARQKAREYSEQAGEKLQKTITEFRESGEPSVKVEPPDDIAPRSDSNKV